MKQHHFVVFGVETEPGKIEFFTDDSAAYLHDGTVWNEKTQEWELCSEGENLERDERVAARLYDLLKGY